MSEKCSHKTETIRFRVATKDRTVMEAAAKSAGLSLSDWMRQTLLLAAAGKTCEVVNPRDDVVVTKVVIPERDPPPVMVRPKVTISEDGARHLSINPDKIAAFQKAAGMGGVKK